MKNLYALGLFLALFSFSYTQTISSFPYLEDFESFTNCGVNCGDMCTLSSDWTNSTLDDIDWTVNSGTTVSLNTGPSFDHTLGDPGGKYLYTETSVPCDDSESHLVSPSLDLVGLPNFQMDFWYHMYGGDMGTMHIDVSSDDGATWTTDVIPSLTDDLDLWQMQSVDLSAYVGDTILVRFRAQTGPSFESDMAIDDVNFYTLFPNDAQVFSIDAPSSPIVPGVLNVDLTIKNVGTSDILTANIEWEVNGAPQAPFVYTGPLTSGMTDGPITIGTFSFPPGTSIIKAWTSVPNGMPDDQPSNDTLEYLVCTGLAGTYTIGGGGDFASFTEVVDLLNTCGVNGPTTFNVLPGSGPYNEQITLGAITGVSSSNPVRFNGGSTMETIQYTGTSSSNRGVIILDGASFVTLDSLTILNNDPAFGFGVHLRGDAQNNAIQNCVIKVDSSTTLNDFCGICISGDEFTTSGENGDNTTIQDNEIYGGYIGIGMRGASTTAFDDGNKILGNKIRSTYYYGVYSYYQSNVDVTNNDIRMRGGATTDYGVYLYYTDAFNVIGNQIKNAARYGLYTYYGNNQGGTPTSRATIANNMIGGGFSTTAPYGIWLTTNSRDIDVYYNSVSLDFGNGRGIYVSGGSGIDIQNNSCALFNSATGYALYVSTLTYVNTVDYNNYHTDTSSNFIYIAGDYDPGTFIGGGGFNFNSHRGNPIYADNKNDLHALGPQLDDRGNPVGITVDIDFDFRDPANPCIGADEFSPVPDDVRVVSIDAPSTNGRALTSNSLGAAEAVTISVQNIGSNIQTDVPVFYSINGTPYGPDTIFGPLNPGVTVSHTFSVSADLSVGGLYTFASWTELVGDMDNANDTVAGWEVYNLANDPVTLPYVQNFDGAPQATYDTYTIGLEGAQEFDFETSDPNGRLRIGVGPDFAASGVHAATMDRVGAGTLTVNDLTLTLNMTGYDLTDSVLLDFSYMQHGEEDHPNDQAFVRGADTLPWLDVHDFSNPLPPGGTYVTIDSVNISQLLLANGQFYTTSFQIRFGQEDDNPAVSITGTDGYTFDDINLYTLPDNDAGIVSVDTPGVPSCTSSPNVYVSIGNFGLQDLNTAVVHWEINGIPMPDFSYTGPTIPPFDQSAPVMIGTHVWTIWDTMVVWTTDPNGVTDSMPFNDTLQIVYREGLSGTYSIGPTGDFPDFQSALNELDTFGVCGPVILRLEAGVSPHMEQVTIPPLVGTSSVNTVTLSGGPGMETIEWGTTTTDDRAVIKMDGASHIILDSLTIINTGSTFGFGVHLTNNANNNIIRNCAISVNKASTSTNYCGIAVSGLTATSNGDNGDNNLIENNAIDGGYYGISLRGLSTTSFDVGNQVINNTITASYFYGVYCYYQDQSIISSNTVLPRIGGAAASYGIYMYYADRFEVDLNQITGAAGYGIYTFNGNNQGGAPTSRARISNNMIGGGFTGTTPYGIYLATNSRQIDVLHNSVSLDGGNGRALYITGGSENDILNNSFATFAGGTSYALYISNTSYVRDVDFNNYYSGLSSNFVYLGTDFTPATYVGGAGFNFNSRDGNPTYVDNAGDLHATGPQLNAGGTGAGVLMDIDGDFRDPANPDIGVDEYDPPAVDIMAVTLLEPNDGDCGDSNTVFRFVVRNMGTDPLTGVLLETQVTGDFTSTMTFTLLGPLSSLETDTITMGTLNTYSGGTIDVLSFASMIGDTIPDNDSLFSTINIFPFPEDPSASSAAGCEGDNVQLVASPANPGDNLLWYDTLGAIVGTGDTLNVTLGATNADYFVQNVIRDTYRVGPQTNTEPGYSGSTYTNFPDGLIFDVFTEIVLDSVFVYAGSAGTVTVNLQDASLATIATASATVTGIGKEKVALGFLISPGAGYRLNAIGSTVTNLYRNTSGASFPIVSPVLQMTGTINALAGYYYFFYDWHVTAPKCEGNLIPVTATTIGSAPVAGYTSAIGATGLDVDFTNASTGINTYSWDFGDGSAASTAVDPAHTYTADGVYVVCLSASNICGVDTVCSSIDACAPMAASFSSAGSGLTVNFAFDGTGTPTDYAWDFGDASIGAGGTPLHAYASDGTYDVCLVITNPCTVDSICQSVTVCAEISAAFAFTNTNLTYDFLFTGTGTPTGYNWSFGDGSTSTDPSPTHTYSSTDTSFTVSLIIENDCGFDTIEQSVFVVGVLDALPGASIGIYPNPTSGAFFIDLQLEDVKDLEMNITDLTGRVLLTEVLTKATGSIRKEIVLENAAAGVYFVRIQGAEGTLVRKVIIE